MQHTPRDADARRPGNGNQGSAGGTPRQHRTAEKTLTAPKHTILLYDSTTLRLFDAGAWLDVPLASLDALLASDASHREIVRRLRLHRALRRLVAALAESEVRL